MNNHTHQEYQAVSVQPSPPASQVLQAATFPLWGSRLIEASAGTGKTWTIAALYLRLVLGHGAENGFGRALRPSDILVMTFTRAATRELSDRIRERLLNAARCFRDEQPIDAGDKFLAALMSGYAPGFERDRAAWALSLAAESMDDASVHTIDAWCQRMLKEHAFDSNNLFDEELVADEKAMTIQAAQDYWRQACYPLAAKPLQQVLDIWNGVDALIADMRNLVEQNIPAEAGKGTLTSVLIQAAEDRAANLSQLKEGWAARAQSMLDWLDAQTSSKNHDWNGRKLSSKNYRVWLGALKDWANGLVDTEKPDLKTGWERFTPMGLLSARKEGAPSLVLPPEFAQFAVFKEAIDRLPEISVAVRLHAAAQVTQRKVELKRQSNSFGFRDMLDRLNAALEGTNGTRLRERILTQYPVVLIDEFQDTSQLQYRIFDQIYEAQTNNKRSAMLLIGDPKQSIYGFRGADISSYIQARRTTAGRHYVLETNFRSTKPLVSVVNHWFSYADSARREGAFMYRCEGDNPLPFVQVKAQGRKEHLVSAQGPVPPMTLVHDLEIYDIKGICKLFAARCAEQIVCWLNDPAAGFVEPSVMGESDTGDRKVGACAQSFRRLRPADIAVLVRTGKEAAAVRRELDRRGVASVYLSDKDSVFQSDVAGDLVHWLRAVATPQDVRLVRTAMATRTVGLSLDELGVLASMDEAFDMRSQQLRQLRTVWQLQGVLAMLRETLHQLGLASRWLIDSDGERKMTNFLHLAELLQTASSTFDSEQALIRWLLAEISKGSAQGDEQVVRLESDADLVKVVTIHKSKGLEYSLVFLPFATSFKEKISRSTPFVNLADSEGHRTLRLRFSQDELALADRDRLREDLRLLYVALTRARHALWVGFAAVKTGKNSLCMSHKSGAGYLLGGLEPIQATGWLPLLEQIADTCADMVLQTAVRDTPCTRLTSTAADTPLQDRPQYQADFERNWTIGSFSHLVKGLTATQQASELSPLQTYRAADDERSLAGSVHEEASVPVQAESDVSSGGWHRFTRGAEAGNFLHDQLEWLAGEGFALPGNAVLAEQLRHRCERAGRGADADDVVSWLTEVVQTCLPGPGMALVDLVDVLPEMEFWLPAQRIEARAVDLQCCLHLLPGQDRPALADRQLHGMLMGFADLVFEHQGKYWVLDYKSNHLGDEDAAYDTDTMAHSMAKHRYDVQAAIYLLALHRLLRQRLGSSYRPEEHLGGAVYLFLRGIKSPQSGVCLIPACLPLLAALDAMLAEEGLPA